MSFILSLCAVVTSANGPDAPDASDAAAAPDAPATGVVVCWCVSARKLPAL